MRDKHNPASMDARAVVKAGTKLPVRVRQDGFTLEDYALKERLFAEASKGMPAGHTAIMDPHQTLAQVFSHRSGIPAEAFEKVPYETLKEKFSKAKQKQPESAVITAVSGVYASMFGSMFASMSLFPDYHDTGKMMTAFFALFAGGAIGSVLGGMKITKNAKKHNRQLGNEAIKQLPAPK